MALFKFQKQDPKELEAERAERMEKTYDSLQAKAAAVNRIKRENIEKCADAQCRGMKTPAALARDSVKKAVVLENRINSMIAMLDHFQSTRELSKLSNDFIHCITDLSSDIIADSDRANYKKAEKNLLKASYKQKKQMDALDKTLSLGDYTFRDGLEDEVSEFDDEINALIGEAVAKRGGSAQDRMKN